MTQSIIIRGARTHNLKNIDVTIPRDKLTVITGLSGSGKSSLAFDTLYAEGQRRYVESLSAYARQFLSMMDKPDVDSIEGLSPAISIEQKATSHNPRSTVGTITEIYDYLRLLYARVGEPRCPTHHISLQAKTVSQMVDTVLAMPANTKAMVLAPIVRDRKGEHVQLFEQLQARGYVRVRIDGTMYELDAVPSLSLRHKHTIEVVVDRFVIREDIGSRLSESFENALKLADGLAIVASLDGNFDEVTFSSRFACTICGYTLSALEPRLFSFNSPMGACSRCDGLGFEPIMGHVQASRGYPGYKEEPALSNVPCRVCEGTRLSVAARNVFVAERSLPEITHAAIADIHTFFNELVLTGARGKIAEKINKEISARLGFLMNVGLEYLTLARSAETLSGGEAQRIRLASQIGSGLVGVMYVLDEPSIGLHQRDNARLLSTLTRLRDLGNTVIVVEHDEDAIRMADYVLDIGPMAGVHGGRVVASGTPADIIAHPDSLTGRYLSRQETIVVPHEQRAIDPDKMIHMEGVSCHNIKNLNVAIPLGVLTCVTGVSGSGKSSLINETLYPLAAKHLYGSNYTGQGTVESIRGLEQFDKVIDIDQSPIGRTPRSNPATYTGLFAPIRELFAGVPESRARGYAVGRFSFNVKGGRCEACEGDGLIKVEMHFLPDVYVVCDVCQGARYNRETLEIRYKGKNIYDVLDMTLEEANVFFEAIPSIARKCQTLVDVGLAYLKLGQSATTLSGGEAQRVKLAKELSRRATGNTLYILDEPTTGLHFHDVRQLMNVLMSLRDQGNTLVIIEHHLDVIKMADWIIDLGPEGGSGGGQLVVAGTPQTVAACRASHTGHFLKAHS